MLVLIMILIFFYFFKEISEFILFVGTGLLIIMAYFLLTSMFSSLSVTAVILIILVMLIALYSIPFRIFYNILDNIFRRR